MRTQIIDLNMTPGVICPVIHVSQYDTDDACLVFNLYADGAFVPQSGATATIVGTKPDGYGFSYVATVSGSTVTASLTQQMTAVAGDVMCELRLADGSDIIGTQNFILRVEEAALGDDTIISDSDIPAIAAAVDAAVAAAGSATTAAGSATAAAASAAQADTDLSQIFGIGTKIGNADDLNGYKTPGKYYADAGQSITNSPVVSSGFAMLVYPAYNVARFVQMVLGLDGSISVRAMYRTQGNTDYWSEWWKSSEVKTLVGKREIATATDFDTITGIGEYWFSPEVASASPNKPFSVGGRMTVEYSVGIDLPNFVRQVASQFNGTDYYARTTSDGGANWTHWFRSSMIDTGA